MPFSRRAQRAIDHALEDAEEAWLLKVDVEDEALPQRNRSESAQPEPERVNQNDSHRSCASSSTSTSNQAEPAWKSLVAGGVAGCLSKTATAPLSRLAILYQVQGSGALHGWSSAEPVSLLAAARRVAKQEGIIAFWKGNGAMLLHRLPYSAINFAVFDAADSALRDSIHSDSTRKLLSGGIGGAVGCTACYPLDLARTRLAASTTSSSQPHAPPTAEHFRHHFAHTVTASASPSASGAAISTGSGGPSVSSSMSSREAATRARAAFLSAHAQKSSIADTLRDALRSGGLRGLFYGWPPTVLQVAPSLAVNFAVYSSCKSTIFKDDGAHSASLVSGSIAGISSAVATFPVDLVRRRMQLSGKPFVETLRSVLSEGGMRALYRGILPECFKVAPGMGLAFLTYEALKASL